jgi:hypothetical protein
VEILRQLSDGPPDNVGLSISNRRRKRGLSSGLTILGADVDAAWPLVLGHPSYSRYRPRETEHSVTCISFGKESMYEQSKLLTVSGRKGKYEPGRGTFEGNYQGAQFEGRLLRFRAKPSTSAA